MWWEDKENGFLRERVQVLVRAWREGELPFVTVIGSTWTEDGERTLFIGVDPYLDPRPWAWAGGSGPVDRAVRRLIRRYGPLPHPTPPEVVDFELPDSDLALETPPTIGSPTRAVTLLARILTGRLRVNAFDLLMMPLDHADADTRALLSQFGVPSSTQIGYISPIRQASKKGLRIHRKATNEHATVGCRFTTDDGTFLTTVGHLGAKKGELVEQDKPARRSGGIPEGEIVAVNLPAPDETAGSVRGLDLAVVKETSKWPTSEWQRVELAEARDLRRQEYVSWTGAQSGFHEAYVMITAAMAAADEDAPYEHAVMASGQPPKGAGRRGDSGSAVYDRRGQLLGHFVGTEGPKSGGTAPHGWFQMIDIAENYLESEFGPIEEFFGNPRNIS